MLVFFWILFSLGVAYGAKISGRKPTLWFALAMLLSPLIASVALVLMNRHGTPPA